MRQHTETLRTVMWGHNQAKISHVCFIWEVYATVSYIWYLPAGIKTSKTYELCASNNDRHLSASISENPGPHCSH